MPTLVFEENEEGQQKMVIHRTGDADPEQYLRKAKELVAQEFNDRFPVLEGGATPDDVYVVWWAKVLGNWKCMISTDLVTGLYWEVTYNGNREETYVDTYTKADNRVVTDSAYATLP